MLDSGDAERKCAESMNQNRPTGWVHESQSPLSNRRRSSPGQVPRPLLVGEGDGWNAGALMITDDINFRQLLAAR